MLKFEIHTNVLLLFSDIKEKTGDMYDNIEAKIEISVFLKTFLV
jgi:hypothetical protein